MKKFISEFKAKRQAYSKDHPKTKAVWVTGFWNDTKAPIEDYKCIIGEDKSFENDDDLEVFFYFTSVADLKSYMKLKAEKDIVKGNGNEFTVTSYHF